MNEANAKQVQDATQTKTMRSTTRREGGRGTNKAKSHGEQSKSTSEYTCPACKGDASEGVVECGKCMEWHHFACVNLVDRADMLQDEDWMCAECEMDTDTALFKTADEESMMNGLMHANSTRGMSEGVEWRTDGGMREGTNALYPDKQHKGEKDPNNQDVLMQKIMTDSNTEGQVGMPHDTVTSFLQVAAQNSENNVETLGLLAGWQGEQGAHITHLVVPLQQGDSASCECLGEALVAQCFQEHGVIQLGWIHTHPAHDTFLSSIDVHTQYNLQREVSGAVATVCSIKHAKTEHYQLTKRGMDIVGQCEREGFHEGCGEARNWKPVQPRTDDANIHVVDLRNLNADCIAEQRPLDMWCSRKKAAIQEGAGSKQHGDGDPAQDGKLQTGRLQERPTEEGSSGIEAAIEDNTGTKQQGSGYSAQDGKMETGPCSKKPTENVRYWKEVATQEKIETRQHGSGGPTQGEAAIQEKIETRQQGSGGPTQDGERQSGHPEKQTEKRSAEEETALQEEAGTRQHRSELSAHEGEQQTGHLSEMSGEEKSVEKEPALQEETDARQHERQPDPEPGKPSNVELPGWNRGEKDMKKNEQPDKDETEGACELGTNAGRITSDNEMKKQEKSNPNEEENRDKPARGRKKKKPGGVETKKGQDRNDKTDGKNEHRTETKKQQGGNHTMREENEGNHEDQEEAEEETEEADSDSRRGGQIEEDEKKQKKDCSHNPVTLKDGAPTREKAEQEVEAMDKSMTEALSTKLDGEVDQDKPKTRADQTRSTATARVKGVTAKRKSGLAAQVAQLRAENQRLRVELHQLKRDRNSLTAEEDDKNANTHHTRHSLCGPCAGYLLRMATTEELGAHGQGKINNRSNGTANAGDPWPQHQESNDNTARDMNVASQETEEATQGEKQDKQNHDPQQRRLCPQEARGKQQEEGDYTQQQGRSIPEVGWQRQEANAPTGQHGCTSMSGVERRRQDRQGVVNHNRQTGEKTTNESRGVLQEPNEQYHPSKGGKPQDDNMNWEELDMQQGHAGGEHNYQHRATDTHASEEQQQEREQCRNQRSRSTMQWTRKHQLDHGGYTRQQRGTSSNEWGDPRGDRRRTAQWTRRHQPHSEGFIGQWGGTGGHGLDEPQQHRRHTTQWTRRQQVDDRGYTVQRGGARGHEPGVPRQDGGRWNARERENRWQGNNDYSNHRSSQEELRHAGTERHGSPEQERRYPWHEENKHHDNRGNIRRTPGYRTTVYRNSAYQDKPRETWTWDTGSHRLEKVKQTGMERRDEMSKNWSWYNTTAEATRGTSSQGAYLRALMSYC